MHGRNQNRKPYLIGAEIAAVLFLLLLLQGCTARKPQGSPVTEPETRPIGAAASVTAVQPADASAAGTESRDLRIGFSRKPGAWPEESFSLELTGPEGCEIFYTTDGSLPDRGSLRYEGEILISGSGSGWVTEETAEILQAVPRFTVNPTPEIPDAWIIRAAAVDAEGRWGPVATGTFFPGCSLLSEYGPVLVASLVTEPDSLFSYERGIMVPGASFENWRDTEEGREILQAGPYYEIVANYTQSGKKWERPASLELFDASEKLSAQTDCGIRIHGGMSRAYPNRSMRVYFREDYGSAALEYPLFPEAVNQVTGEPVTRFQSLVFRNGGNSTNAMPYKDSWLQGLLRDAGFGVQCARPAVLYLNGEFWGVYVLNDRYSSAYLRDYYGVDDALLVKEGELQDGREEDMALYEELCAFAEQDLADPGNWQRFRETVDVPGMAAYFAAQIYIANKDFLPDKNIELWRSVETDSENPWADGRWRFLLYDTEYSTGLYWQEETRSEYDSLSEALENHPLFRSAMENEEFRELFQSSLREISDYYLSPWIVNISLQRQNEKWKSLMQEHHRRFGEPEIPPEGLNWNIKNFFRDRAQAFLPKAEALLRQYGAQP